MIYVALGTLITYAFGADSLNELSTSVSFNVIFFGLLIFFAASFLGAFEIVLPNSWANKVDRQADRGGIIGIFFMALALAVVSFSCTGPIVGTLIVEAAYKSGAIRTALDTVKLLRPVMAIPGPISSPLSAGVNRLIADRVAELVASSWEIEEMVGAYGQDSLSGQLRLDSDGMINPCQTQSNQPQIFGQGLSLS